MLFAWNTIQAAEDHDVRHRKGFTMREASLQIMTNHAHEELAELEAARRADEPEEELDELADVFGCLIHYAVRRGWSVREVENALIRKLLLRLDFEGTGVSVDALKSMVSQD